MRKTISKSRNFAFVLYPESMPDDWKNILEYKLDVSMAISPIHNKDISETGNNKYKKEHYHVLYIAHNCVTAESVRKKIKRALGNNSISHVEIVDNVLNYYKYLTHDSADAIRKNKHKYSIKEITHINGFDIDRYIYMDESQKQAFLNVILKIIKDNNIANVFELYDFVELNGSNYGVSKMSTVNDIIKSNTGIFRLYFDGAYQNRKLDN